VLFEGSERAVAAQLAAARALVGGAEADRSVWDESRERQAAARSRIRFAPGQLAAMLADVPEAVVRVAAGVAYTPIPSDTVSRGREHELVRRIQQELDPRGVLAA
jgi:hypothetical protein